MGHDEDEAARAARARDIREKIRGLKTGKAKPPAAGEENPRDFVHRRMKEDE